MDYFENTTRVTEEGYTAILKMKQKKKQVFCRLCSIVLAIPFAQRFIYYILLIHIKGGSVIELHFLDIVFILLLLTGIWLWRYPKAALRNAVRTSSNRSAFQTVNQYAFLPEGIRMMTTASMEKYLLPYNNMTWIRSNKRWIVVYFEKQDFTMLVDKQGFTKGTASACLAMLLNKIEGK